MALVIRARIRTGLISIRYHAAYKGFLTQKQQDISSENKKNHPKKRLSVERYVISF